MNVSEQVIATLDAGLCEGNQFILQGQLDRKAYTDVNKVLVAAGAKWNRSAKAHLFDCDAQDAISDIVLTGKVIDAKREFDFFETPDALADKIIDAAQIAPHHNFLEPSAGSGQIAKRATVLTSDVDVIEIQEALHDTMMCSGEYANTTHGDFLVLDNIQRYDRIVMNPPFGRQADIKHVSKAIGLLKPGGRIVAIMSAGVTFRSNKLTEDFRSLVAIHDGVIESLPEGSFKTSGTTVNTVMLTLDKNINED
jgi:predicted RNA methylase